MNVKLCRIVSTFLVLTLQLAVAPTPNASKAETALAIASAVLPPNADSIVALTSAHQSSHDTTNEPHSDISAAINMQGIWQTFTTSNSGLPSNCVHASAIDLDGTKWFGTCGGGAAHFDGTQWTVYNTSNSGLPSNDIRHMAIDNTGAKWFCTLGGGVARFDGTTWTVYNTSNSGLPDNNVWAVAFDIDGAKWIGTQSGGVARFDDLNWTVYNTSNSALPNNFGRGITIDSNGTKWIATYGGGVARLNGTTWTIYNTSNSGLHSNSPIFTAIDKDGAKWFGSEYNSTGSGASRFDGSTWITYNTTNSGLPNNIVGFIAFDSDGTKWFSTGGGGVARFDGVAWTVYNASNSGLPNNVSGSIVIDKNGVKWFSTLGGIGALWEGQYQISGRVIDTNNNPISNVTISFSPYGFAATNANGYYTITNLITGTYTLTPTKSGYTFSPSSRTVSVPPDATGQDFTGSPTSVDMGFRPNPNGYRFSNYGGLYPLPPAIDDYTIADMRRMFGDAAVCNMVGPICVVKWTALKWNWELNRAMNVGHCYGMAVTSLRFFKGLDDPSGFQAGAGTTHDLLLANARRNIAYYFVEQAADPAKSYISQMRQNAPSVILDQLRLFISGSAPDPMALAMWQAGQGGHAVTPYAIQDQGNGILWVKVYDNNHPDDANRYVVINTNDETWSYDLGSTTWSGRAVSHTLTIVPLSQNPEHPVCPWCASSISLDTLSASPSAEIWLAGQGHLLITDLQGRRIGYVGNQFVNEVPDAYEGTLIGGLGIPMEPVYNLPLTSTYTILLDGQILTQTGVVAVTQFGPGYAVSADGVTLNPTSQDRLSITPDGTQLGYHSSESKAVTLTLAMDGSSSNQFQIKNASVGAGQAVTLTNNAISGTLEFDNSHASGGKYDLEINLTTAAGEHRFVHAGVVISATDTHYVSYGSWSGAGGLTLQIDHGSNGTIDETLVLSNQAWQVYLPVVIRSQ
jgi:hypothetical protein